MEIAIDAKGLGKRYALGTREPYNTLRDSVARAVAAPLRMLQAAVGRNGHSTATQPSLWALNDVSFTIRQGEIVGIIGRNGSGKSTLLKILSRITEPTVGEAKVRGRVGSLLEVGTGFHPELTGRENVLVNGALLGLKRADVARQFDDIIAFADVDQFVDTPVKFYSSGMQMRLAFAVAAFLEPEVLLIDEVLAVGDMAFQRKCLGVIDRVANSGRTVLFVSHNLAVVSNLCPRAILLDRGRLVADDASRVVIDQYLESGRDLGGERSWDDESTPPGNSRVRLRAIRIVSQQRVTADVSIDEPFEVQVEYETLLPHLEISTSIHLVHPVAGEVLVTADYPSASIRQDDWFGKPLPKGVFRARCAFPRNFLNEGTYSINVVLLTRVSLIEVLEREVLQFLAYDDGGMRREYGGGWLGVVRPKLPWHTEFLGPHMHHPAPASAGMAAVSEEAASTRKVVDALHAPPQLTR